VRGVLRVQRNALLIPQAAVSEQQGSYQIAVVGSDDRVDIRPVQVGERTGTMWVIQDGLKLGARVVVRGQQNLRPGMPVQTKPFKGDEEDRRSRTAQGSKGSPHPFATAFQNVGQPPPGHRAHHRVDP
jgi:hypothetical protein